VSGSASACALERRADFPGLNRHYWSGQGRPRLGNVGISRLAFRSGGLDGLGVQCVLKPPRGHRKHVQPLVTTDRLVCSGLHTGTPPQQRHLGPVWIYRSCNADGERQITFGGVAQKAAVWTQHDWKFGIVDLEPLDQ